MVLAVQTATGKLKSTNNQGSHRASSQHTRAAQDCFFGDMQCHISRLAGPQPCQERATFTHLYQTGLFDLPVMVVSCAVRSSTETLNAEDKFFCDACSGLQEAQKRFKIKVLPPVLCLHLKRFKYIEQYDRCALCSPSPPMTGCAWL